MSEECVVSKVLDVDKMKQSLSSFSFSKEDTEFKPPKKTKGGRDPHLFLAYISNTLSVTNTH